MVWSEESEPAMCFSFFPKSELQRGSFTAACGEEEGIASLWCLYFVYKIWRIGGVTKPGFKDLQ